MSWSNSWPYSKAKKYVLENLPECLKGKINILPDHTREPIPCEIPGKHYTLYLGNLENDLYNYEYAWGSFSHDLSRSLKEYLQVGPKKASENKDAFIRFLTLLDRRTGKRTLKKYLDDGDFVAAVKADQKELVKVYKIRFLEDNIVPEERLTVIELLARN